MTEPVLEPLPEFPRYEIEPRSGLEEIGPNFGHVCILLPLLFAGVAGGSFLFLLLAHTFHYMGHHVMAVYRDMAESDARVSLPMQGCAYLLAFGLVYAAFRVVWNKPVAQGLHWNAKAAVRRLGWLCLTGLACGFGSAILGSFLPMPKDPPILADMMHSTAGAWLMLIFGVTAAPAFEEMVFRGFLLPAFLNAFRWLRMRGDLSENTTRLLAVPASAVLTSLPFALLHGAQVSHAWGPILVIGLISMVLCFVRLRMRSLAASTLVHASYNFTLFAGILIQTAGFTHLERMQ